MSAKYLLSCGCGQRNVVGPPQAGETIVCQCGAALEVPAMLAMTALEPAPTDSMRAAADSVWGWRQQMLLLGVVLVSAAMALGVWLYVKRPPADIVDPENIQRTARRFPPALTWTVWQTMKQGLDRRVDQDAVRNREIHGWMVAGAAILGLLGAALAVAGLSAGRSEEGPCKVGDEVATSYPENT
jgi:hypothetical protein